MSLNTANTPDGRGGVIIYNGEIILLFVREVNLSFTTFPHPDFKGAKKGSIYLTSHRIIFIDGSGAGNFKSISMPFTCIRNVKLEQPIFGANYLTGEVIAQPNGGFQGEAAWKLTFNRGGAIDFGQALLKSEEMTLNFSRRPFDAPPAYAPPAGAFYSAPPAYYWTGGNYNGYQAPVHAFPDQPPPENVFMYEQPPPYPGMGPAQPNPPPPGFYPNLDGGNQQPQPNVANSSASAPPYQAPAANNWAPYPSQPPSYNQATTLPQKAHMD